MSFLADLTAAVSAVTALCWTFGNSLQRTARVCTLGLLVAIAASLWAYATFALPNRIEENCRAKLIAANAHTSQIDIRRSLDSELTNWHFKVRVGLTILLVGLALQAVALWPNREILQRPAALLNAMIAWLFARPSAVILTVALTAWAAVAIQSFVYPPYPIVHDEFCYLLSADTFYHGRLANPPHPLWEHFETFHVLSSPTYVAKYPPGQGLLLALGRLLTGEYSGALPIAAAITSAAVCWLFLGWMPAKWSLIGGLAATLHPALFREWSQSFMGGQLALIGGSLVYGATIRIERSPRMRDALLLGIGAAILALNRPFEGLITIIPAAVWMTHWTWRHPIVFADKIARVIAPSLLPISLAALFLIQCNLAGTGQPFRFPYLLYQEQYESTSLIGGDVRKPTMTSSHEPIRKFYALPQHVVVIPPASWSERLWAAFRLRTSLLNCSRFYFQSPLDWTLLAVPLVLWIRGPWLPFAAVAALLIGHSLSAGAGYSRYLAPIGGLLILFAIMGLREMCEWRLLKSKLGLGVAQFILIAGLLGCLQQAGVREASRKSSHWAECRERILRTLSNDRDRHVIVVRYSEHHDPHCEWVYNLARLDDDRVVWAREMGERDRELIEWFPNHKFWILEPDLPTPTLVPHPLANPGQQAATALRFEPGANWR